MVVCLTTRYRIIFICNSQPKEYLFLQLLFLSLFSYPVKITNHLNIYIETLVLSLVNKDLLNKHSQVCIRNISA